MPVMRSSAPLIASSIMPPVSLPRDNDPVRFAVDITDGINQIFRRDFPVNINQHTRIDRKQAGFHHLLLIQRADFPPRYQLPLCPRFSRFNLLFR
ncbi:Uncharacterised protein [Klebsiella pneumoniae]|nr:Uncharacterised protein [Klebsiella pneumoniae]